LIDPSIAFNAGEGDDQIAKAGRFSVGLDSSQKRMV
jgi:hypothetical protein